VGAEFDMLNFLSDGPSDAALSLALAHGAGAAMDTKFMQYFAKHLGTRGYRITRFEFPYMAERRITGKKRPPDHLSKLQETWMAIISYLGPENLVIGGKSMGGRIASIVADEASVKGLLCLGYPFHAPGKLPGPNRLEQLKSLQTPTLICQGTRDAFGTIDQVSKYRLSNSIKLHWVEDGDHGFKPRKQSGQTEEKNWRNALDASCAFLEGLKSIS